jgi:hypothetical protein
MRPPTMMTLTWRPRIVYYKIPTTNRQHVSMGLHVKKRYSNNIMSRTPVSTRWDALRRFPPKHRLSQLKRIHYRRHIRVKASQPPFGQLIKRRHGQDVSKWSTAYIFFAFLFLRGEENGLPKSIDGDLTRLPEILYFVKPILICLLDVCS